MFVRLSHIIDGSDPGWPGASTCEVTTEASIADGAVSNAFTIKLFNHFGTHFDAPNHYNADGLKISELPLEDFVYERPLLLDIPKSYEEFVRPEDLAPFYSALEQADFLMLRSGFSPLRKSDPHAYAHRGPGVSADACKYLMDHFQLKALAVDWISLASVPHTADGTLAHQYLLGCHHPHYTCIIEDACFEPIVGKKVRRVYALPLLVGMGVDSGPVTIVAEIDD